MKDKSRAHVAIRVPTHKPSEHSCFAPSIYYEASSEPWMYLDWQE